MVNDSAHRSMSRFDIIDTPPKSLLRNLIFIHIPKTGGSSIRSSILGDKGMGHKTALAYRRYDSNLFERSYKFSVLRNPLDRIVSSYFYEMKRGATGRNCDEIVSRSSCFEDFCENICEEFVDQTNPGFLPQMWWITDKFHRVIIDDIFLYDFIGESMDAVNTKLGTQRRLSHINKSEHDHFMKYHTNRTIEIINDIYSFDMSIYNRLMDDRGSEL